jgi:hypothetical protein
VNSNGTFSDDDAVSIHFVRTGDDGTSSGAYDLNGAELVLDADGDTSITADTDDQIDIRISGADDFVFKANTFEVQTGSNIDMNGTELILDANGNTSITADTDDQIDFKIAGADDFRITANTVSVLSGTTLNIDSGATIANSGTATGFGGLSFIAGATASSSASVSFASGISSTYETYVITFNNVVPATDTVTFNMRTSTDGGSSYESSSGNYRYVCERGSQGGTGVTGSASATEIILVAAGSGIGSDTGEGFNGIAYLYHPSNSGLYTSISSHGHYQDGAADSMYYQSSGTRIAAADVDAIQFYFSSGNIESGEINLYGMAKS